MHANAESFNNEIGLPLTVLGADEHTEVLVTEMGARFAGNISGAVRDRSSRDRGRHQRRPRARRAPRGSRRHHRGQGRVARGPPARLVSRSSTATTRSTPRLVARGAAPVLRCGSGSGSRHASHPLHARRRVARLDRRQDALGHRHDEARRAEASTRRPTRCSRSRSRAGSGCPPISIAAGLAAATGSRWRLELERRADGVTVLNDVYNANPTSMAAALRALAALPTSGRRIAVLGRDA